MTPSEALRRHGSDKVIDHSYGPVYDSLFGLRQSPIRAILEVGVLEGASLRGWADAFPEAIVYGLDVRLVPQQPSERIRVAQADTADPASIARALPALGLAPYALDAIIDDAAHTFRDQIAALMLLWDFLRPGGLYVIEDIAPSSPHAPFVRLGGVIHDLRHLKNRHDDVLAIFHKPGT